MLTSDKGKTGSLELGISTALLSSGSPGTPGAPVISVGVGMIAGKDGIGSVSKTSVTSGRASGGSFPVPRGASGKDAPGNVDSGSWPVMPGISGNVGVRSFPVTSGMPVGISGIAKVVGTTPGRFETLSVGISSGIGTGITMLVGCSSYVKTSVSLKFLIEVE